VATFGGSFKHMLDGKGRVSLPSRFRKTIRDSALGGEFRLWLTRGLDGCLFVYPESAWEKQQQVLEALPANSREARLYVRQIMESTYEARMDSVGRITVPSQLLELAGLEKGGEVMVLGALSRFELWDPERYETHMDSDASSFEDRAERFLL
jgi:MraZ protein